MGASRLPPVASKSGKGAAAPKQAAPTGGGLHLPPVDGNHVIPLVDMAMWSTNLEVKRDAVQGLLSLAESNRNLEVMGKMNALSVLGDLVFRPEASECGESPKKKKTARFRVVKPGALAASLGESEASAVSVAAADDHQPPSPGRTATSAPDIAAEASQASNLSAEPSGSLMQKVMFKAARGDLKLQRLAAHAISLLLAHPANQELFFKLGYLDNVCKLALSSPNPNIRRSMAVILLNLAKNPSNRETLFEFPPCLEATHHLALIPDERTRLCAFGVYKRLAMSASNSEKWPEPDIKQLFEFLGTSLDLRLHMLTLETLTHLVQLKRNAVMVGGLENYPEVFANFIDLERYNDSVRLLASACIEKLSDFDENLPSLGSSEFLLNKLRQGIDHSMSVKDYDAARMDLSTLAHVAKIGEVADKLIANGFLDSLFVYSGMPDKSCRRQSMRAIRLISTHNPDAADDVVLRNISKLTNLMCKVQDYSIQMDSLTIMARLSQNEETISKYLIDDLGMIVNQLEDWGVLPDPELGVLATNLAANLAQNKTAKLMLGLVNPVVKNLVAGIKSKDEEQQRASVRFVSNLAEEADETTKAAVVEVGAIWRMRSIAKRDDVGAMTKAAVVSTLKSSLAEHHAAILIQAIIRGRIHRKRAKAREDAARKREEERLRKEQEADRRAAEAAEAEDATAEA